MSSQALIGNPPPLFHFPNDGFPFFDSLNRLMAVFYCLETLIILPQSGILNRICLGNAGVLPLDGGMCVKRLRRMGSAGLAAALLVFCVSGCSTIPKELLTGSSEAPAPVSSEVPHPAVSTVFTLSFSREDTLNPYAAKTRVNLDLATLLYSGLTTLDESFTPQMAAATSVSSGDATHWTAVIREGALFSDGSQVTPADVTASFQLAKGSANYKELVSNIVSAEASGKNAVIFTLSSPDPNTAACLTFPILKAGTVTNEAGKAPVGGGPYVYRPGENSYTLEANGRSGKTLSIPSIRLLHLPDDVAMLHGLENGSISFYYSDLSSGDIPRTSHSSIQVPLNYLVFLGVNAGRGDLSSAAVRRALSNAIGRTEIAETAFAGRAQAAVTPFHPLWKPVVEMKGFSTGENLTQAVAELEAAGYNTKSGSAPSKNTKALTLELIYPTGNDFRKTTAEVLTQQLAKANITLKATALEFSAYKDRLGKGDYDLYLGEIRLTGDMNLRPLLAGGSASYGIQAAGAGAAAYGQYLAGGKTLAEFVETFVQDVPYIPLCWRKGLAAYSRTMSHITPNASDIYYGIESWSLSG